MEEGQQQEEGGLTREDEFLQLFARSQRSVHAYILAIVHDTNTAADLLQETNIVLWCKFDQYKSGTNFSAWAREIARLSILRHRQTSAKRIATLDPHLLEELAEGVSERVDSMDQKQVALKGCMQKLKANDQELIKWRYRSGTTVRELAAKSERSENSISQSLYRIRRALMECIERSLQSSQRAE